MKKIAFLTVSCLVVLVLLLASCGTKTEETTTPTTVTSTATTVKPTTTTTAPTTTTTKPTSAATTPVYGGTLTDMINRDVQSMDDINPWICNCFGAMHTVEQFFMGKWEDGPAGGYGTNKMTWLMSGGFERGDPWMHGGLAPEWSVNPADNSITLNLRKGVYFWNKAPTNGREMTSDDAVFSINRQWGPGTFLTGSYPKPTKVEAVDKYTVKVSFKSFSDMTNDLMQLGGLISVWPRDAVEKFGNMQDWRNHVGTGAFMISDYVKGASMTFDKNPNWWGVDPVGPGKGNKLPYVDKVKMLIIPDASTQQAAAITGKIDIGWPFILEQMKTIRKSAPEVKSIGNYFTVYSIFMRMDLPDAAWVKSKQVRQAMHMAIDFKGIVDTYWGGEGAWYDWPTPANKEYDPMRVPFDSLPANLKELWSGNLEKAKQMMKDAGYEKGFDLKIDYETTPTFYTDILSIYKDTWAKLNINLILQPKDPASFTSIAGTKKHEQAYYYTTHTALLFNMDSWRTPDLMVWNGGMIRDQKSDDTWRAIWDAFLDVDKQCAIWKEYSMYNMEQCWMIPTPQWTQYTIWQPWVMNYSGELNVGGNCRRIYAPWQVWLDRDMKFKATGIK